MPIAFSLKVKTRDCRLSKVRDRLDANNHADLAVNGTAKIAKSRKRPESRSIPALELSEVGESLYSSSIWLYITLSVRQAFDSAFRIGVLHLVARRATSERLDDDSERASKRSLMRAIRAAALQGCGSLLDGPTAQPPNRQQQKRACDPDDQR